MAVTTNPKGMTVKQPGEVVDYDFLWEDTLAEWNDTIQTGLVLCNDVSLTLGATVVSPTRVKQWTSAGLTGTKYKLTNYIHTVGGRDLEQEMYITVKEL